MSELDSKKWVYEAFYFGHGGWPDEAIWRLDSEGKELWMPYGLLVETVEECELLWLKHRTASDKEPSIKEQAEMWVLGWWRSFDEETTQRIYERDQHDGWGEPSSLQPDKDSTPLQEA